jgi:RNA polymerase sigma-70 factor (ECF subfamily)
MKTTTSEAWEPPAGEAGPAETIQEVLHGEPDAFRTLVERHAPAVFALCRRLLNGNPHDAEEVTQETFFNAYRYLHRLVDRRRFQPWLYQIARSLCRDRRRRWAVEQRALAACRESILARQRAAVGSSGDHEVTEALAELPEDERRVLGLRYFEGLSYNELSNRLNLSHSQVDHLIRKARGRLARRLTVRQQVESR